MTKQKPGKKGVVRIAKVMVAVIVLAVIGLVGWIYLMPILTADSITLYDSYTVESGEIKTALSFSASLDVKKSQTYTASELSRVKELYVESGKEVLKGDPLVMLSNGELFTASFDGVVNEIRVSVGDWVRPNFSVVQIGDLVNLQVTMNVDEYDVKSLAVGQQCTVSIISLDIDFETTITHINRVSSTSGTLPYYTVSCDLTVPPEVLPGMRATVNIPSQTIQDVNVLAISALAFDEFDKPYTLVKYAQGTYEKQYVETGLSDGMQVEILSGLSSGDIVYVISGKESAKAGFSFEDIYRSLTGEKVVIHETAGQRQGNAEMPMGFNESGLDGSGFPGIEDADFSFDDMPVPDTSFTP